MNGAAGNSLTELVVILTAMAVGGFVKGVTGTGLPQIAIPAMALFLGVEHAVVVMAIPGVVTNIWLLWAHREHWRTTTRDIPILVGAGALGAVAGTFGLRLLEPRILSLGLGLVIVLYLIVRLLKSNLHVSGELAKYLSSPIGLIAGFFQGSTGVSGPLLTMYLHSRQLARNAFVVSIASAFLTLAIVQTATLSFLGMFDVQRVAQGFLALVPILLVMWIAGRYANRINARLFDRWILFLLALFAIVLIYEGIVG